MGDKEGFRLRTIRLKKQISQGLIIPLDLNKFPNAQVGDDLTEALGIELYETPIPAQLAGQVKGNFPSFFHKTDQERIQNLTRKYPELIKAQYVATEKLEGTSLSTYSNKKIKMKKLETEHKILSEIINQKVKIELANYHTELNRILCFLIAFKKFEISKCSSILLSNYTQVFLYENKPFLQTTVSPPLIWQAVNPDYLDAGYWIKDCGYYLPTCTLFKKDV